MADVVMPGLSGPSVSPIYVDGMPLEGLLEVLDSDQAPEIQWSAPSRFWATPSRPSGSLLHEAMVVQVTANRLMNRMQFQVANFPCRVWLQYWDTKAQKWQAMQDEATTQDAVVTVLDAVPAVIRSDVYDSLNLHPQHRGAGHWRTVDMRIKAISTNRVRLVLGRLTTRGVPRHPDGTAADYSLAIQGFKFGYQILSRADIPEVDKTQDETLAVSFAYSSDVLGSSLGFSVIDYEASSLADSGAAIWKSTPQPVANAVVPLWIDCRDPYGQGQSIDRFEIEPITTGVSANLYYTDDEPDPSIAVAASDRVLNARLTGVDPRPEDPSDPEEGLYFGSGYLDLDNRYVQWNADQDWSIGLSIQPTWSSNSGTTNRCLIDSAALRVVWNNNTLTVTVNQTPLTFTPTFAINDQMNLVVRYEGGVATVSLAVGGQLFTTSASVSTMPRDVKVVRLGASTTSPQPSGWRLRQASLKQGPWGQSMLGFITDPESLVSGEKTDNAILRISGTFRSALNPYGIRGGPGDIYEALRWIPINRDFRLAKGMIKFDPIRARFIKFEFTNLVARPYSASQVVHRQVLLYPDDAMLTQRLRKVAGASDASPGGSGAVINQDLGAQTKFTDQRGLRWARTTGYSDYSPTEALYSTDATAQTRLLDVSPAFGLTPWHQGAGAPRFAQTQVHRYKVVTIAHDTKVAYEVGLKSLRMFKVDYAVPDDTEEYQFSFHDAQGLDVAAESWKIDERGGLASPQELPYDRVQTTSGTLAARRNVRGTQFATSQTQPTQLLTDPGFNDPTLQYWETYGNARISTPDDVASGLGSMVRIDRTNEGAYWNYVEDRWDSWDAIEGSDPSPALPTWDDISGSDSSIAAVGGVTSKQFVSVARQGRVYAAARVYAPEPLSAPLHVQIFGRGGQVLADTRIEPSAGQIIEWYASWTISEGGVPETFQTWAQVAAAHPTWGDLEGVTWDTLMGYTPPEDGYSGDVSARVFQEGATEDVFYVDDLSLFEDSIIWEFSNDDGDTWYPAYDIRNNPDGVLVFPTVLNETMRPDDGAHLRWRVTTYKPNKHVSSLTVRPWYASVGKSVLPKETIEQGGANLSPYDQYPSVRDSPQFKTWSRPVPEDWWFYFRQQIPQPTVVPIAANNGSGVYISDTLTIEG